MIATYASVSLRMNTPTPRPCWIYGDPANTDEHRRKRSDLVARYGASWTPEQQPFVIRGDASTRSTRIQGPNNRKNLYQRMLCDACNSTRTKPFDHAYQQLPDWVLASAATLHERNAIEQKLTGSGVAIQLLELTSFASGDT